MVQPRQAQLMLITIIIMHGESIDGSLASGIRVDGLIVVSRRRGLLVICPMHAFRPSIPAVTALSRLTTIWRRAMRLRRSTISARRSIVLLREAGRIIGWWRRVRSVVVLPSKVVRRQRLLRIAVRSSVITPSRPRTA